MARRFVHLAALSAVALSLGAGVGNADNNTTLVAMSGAGQASERAPRWYSSGDVERGAAVYAQNCALCHGGSAEGGIAAPALDGSGHSAHHGLDYLLDQVAQGGARKGGLMPAFGEVLTAEERRAAIAYVQSLWPEAVYRKWQASQGGHQH